MRLPPHKFGASPPLGLDNGGHWVWDVCEADKCNAHVGRGGDYHYHGDPVGTLGSKIGVFLWVISAYQDLGRVLVWWAFDEKMGVV